jgi:zinc transport system permease protein
VIEDFLLRAFLAGLGVVLLAGPLGCFIVWRRMAYFGDSLAHNALLGIALGLLLGIDLSVGVLVGSAMLAAFLLVMQQQKQFASDTLLGLMAHAGLAFGLVVLSFFETLRVDLLSYLFGDILAASPTDLVWIYISAFVGLIVLVAIWRPLLAITVHEDLARAEGVALWPTRLAFILLIAIVISIAMKVVGILLITALLIIPAATARRFAETPEQMAVLAVVAGALAVVFGLAGSVVWDTPSGPSVVVAAFLGFLVSLAAGGMRRHARANSPTAH